MRFEEKALYIRSKNAGPFSMTIDIFCADTADFGELCASKNVKPEVFADIFHVSAEKVKIFFLNDLKVIKISAPRPEIQGGAYERDMHFGQQYVKILDLEV